MHADPLDERSIYLTGRYMGKGSVMKFSKENAQLKWSAQLKELTNIRGYDFSDDGSLFVCGDNFKMELLGKDPAEADYNAGIAFLTSEGDITNYVYT